MLEVVKNFRKSRWISIKGGCASISKRPAYLKDTGQYYSSNFKDDWFGDSPLIVGQDIANLELTIKDQVFVALSVNITSRRQGQDLTGQIGQIESIGFDRDKPYYFKLVIPVGEKFDFHYSIEQIIFDTDLGYSSRTATLVRLDVSDIEVYVVNDQRKEHFLVFESCSQLTYDKFMDTIHAINVCLGYIIGKFAGDQRYCFAYHGRSQTSHDHFHFSSYRQSLNSRHNPVYANAYGWIDDRDIAELYHKELRPLSIKEFSSLCQKTMDSIDFLGVLLLILESMSASMVFRPGGLAIALETLTELFKDDQKALLPIPDKNLAKEFRRQIVELLKTIEPALSPAGIEALNKKISNINQNTNNNKLKAPFAKYGIVLNVADNAIIKSRDELLHGRTPLLGKKKFANEQEEGKHLFYCSSKLYTLLNMLILKSIGYDNRVVNYPKIDESFTGFILNEDHYRLV